MMTSDRPNQTIVVMIDSLRWDTFHRNELKGFQECRQRLTRLEPAICGSFPTLPVRKDLWTGTLSFLSDRWGPISPSETLLPRRLSQSGVRTVLVTDNHILVDGLAGGNYQIGFDQWVYVRGHESDQWSTSAPSQDLPPPDEHTRNPRYWEQFRRNYSRMSASGFTLGRLHDELDGVLSDIVQSDFFLWIDCFDLHEPWCPGHKTLSPRSLSAGVLYPVYGSSADRNPRDVATIQRLYLEQAKLVDEWTLNLWRLLEKHGIADSANLIFMSDHGFYLGEFGLIGKPKNAPLLAPVIRIPLYARLPQQAMNILRANRIVQPHHVYQGLLASFGLDTVAVDSRSTSTLTGRHSPYSSHIQVIIGDKIVSLGRSGARSVCSEIDSFASDIAWPDLEEPDRSDEDAARSELDLVRGTEWVGRFLNESEVD